MKYLKILLLLVVPMVIVSCGNKKEKKLKNQYIEACVDGDFDKARAYAQKLETINSWESREGIKYVNDKEIYALLAKPSRDNDARIMYLYNTYESYQLPDMKDVLDVAVSMENENLAQKLINAGVTPPDDLIRTAINNNLENLVDFMLTKYPQNIVKQDVANYYEERFGKKKLLDKVLMVSNEDLESVLSSPIFQKYIDSDDEFLSELNNNLKKELVDIKKSAPKIHSQGVVDWDWGSDNDNEVNYKIKAIDEYNNKLHIIFNNALILNNKDIAKEAIDVMLPTIEIFEGSGSKDRYDDNRSRIHGYVVDGNHKLVYYNYDQINRLKKQLK